ncbi:hypothetical protein EJB05_08765, partial [Eragrostis curvula]
MGMEVKVNKEIEMLRLLSNCSNVVKLHNVIETSETVYIVMEYCKNGELFDHLILKGRLSEDEARRIFRQIISGVEYCHRNMVVHCDLTVGNLLLDSDYNVKLANFEFSNIMQDGQFPNAYGGSTMYAAPEVISGAQYIGGEVDVWSCGVVLYALLCGTLPFDSENTTKLHQDIKDCAYTVPGHLTVLARDLIGRMLVVNPKRRITISEVGRHAWLQDAKEWKRYPV